MTYSGGNTSYCYLHVSLEGDMRVMPIIFAHEHCKLHLEQHERRQQCLLLPLSPTVFLLEIRFLQFSEHLLLYLCPSCQLTIRSHRLAACHELGLPLILNVFAVVLLGHQVLSKDYYYQTYHYPYDLAYKFVELIFSLTFQFYWCPKTTCK